MSEAGRATRDTTMRATKPTVAALAGHISRTVLAAMLALTTASPARAEQFGDMLRSMAPQIQAATAAAQAAKPQAAPPQARSANAADAGAMQMQSATALPPLHRLGTDAVAVVDDVTGSTAVRPMDYLFAKQTVSLGPKGRMTMSYLSGCLTETVQGGVVTISATGSHVAGGKLAPRSTPGCRAARPIILASASEAGATVNRITPFTGGSWDERALKTPDPVFKWDQALGVASVRVKNLDSPGDPVVWQAPVTGDFRVYPAKTAPRLTPGAPFKAEALAGERVVASAVFSIDPALDEADNLANRIVPLSTP